MVTFGLKSSRRVVFSPSNMSSSRNRSLHLDGGYSTCMHPLRFHVVNDRADGHDADPVHQALLPRQNEDRRNEDVSQRERNHPLPAEIHQLIEAEAGK